MTQYEVIKSANIQDMALLLASLVAGALGGTEPEEFHQIQQEILAFLKSEARV